MSKFYNPDWTLQKPFTAPVGMQQLQLDTSSFPVIPVPQPAGNPGMDIAMQAVQPVVNNAVAGAANELGTAMRHGTNLGSQQTAMLAAQEAGGDLAAAAAGGAASGVPLIGAALQGAATGDWESAGLAGLGGILGGAAFGPIGAMVGSKAPRLLGFEAGTPSVQGYQSGTASAGKGAPVRSQSIMERDRQRGQEPTPYAADPVNSGGKGGGSPQPVQQAPIAQPGRVGAEFGAPQTNNMGYTNGQVGSGRGDGAPSNPIQATSQFEYLKKPVGVPGSGGSSGNGGSDNGGNGATNSPSSWGSSSYGWGSGGFDNASGSGSWTTHNDGTSSITTDTGNTYTEAAPSQSGGGGK
jgi:hypothetical protein